MTSTEPLKSTEYFTRFEIQKNRDYCEGADPDATIYRITLFHEGTIQNPGEKWAYSTGWRLTSLEAYLAYCRMPGTPPTDNLFAS